MARLMIDMYKLLSSYQGVTLYTRCLIWDAVHRIRRHIFRYYSGSDEKSGVVRGV